MTTKTAARSSRPIQQLSFCFDDRITNLIITYLNNLIPRECSAYPQGFIRNELCQHTTKKTIHCYKSSGLATVHSTFRGLNSNVWNHQQAGPLGAPVRLVLICSPITSLWTAKRSWQKIKDNLRVDLGPDVRLNALQF